MAWRRLFSSPFGTEKLWGKHFDSQVYLTSNTVNLSWTLVCEKNINKTWKDIMHPGKLNLAMNKWRCSNWSNLIGVGSNGNSLSYLNLLVCQCNMDELFQLFSNFLVPCFVLWNQVQLIRNVVHIFVMYSRIILSRHGIMWKGISAVRMVSWFRRWLIMVTSYSVLVQR